MEISKKQQHEDLLREFRGKYEVRFPTVQEFKSYLTGLSKDESVTKFCKSGACPIAQWALDTLGLPKSSKVFVDGNSISVNARSKGYIVETSTFLEETGWVNDFIHRVDTLQGDNGDWQAVSPQQALKCLRDATKLS